MEKENNIYGKYFEKPKQAIEYYSKQGAQGLLVNGVQALSSEMLPQGAGAAPRHH